MFLKFKLLVLGADFLWLVGAINLAYYTRKLLAQTELSWLSPVFYNWSGWQLVYITVLGSLLWLLLLALSGLYALPRAHFIHKIFKIITASSFFVLLIISGIFWQHQILFVSRFIILITWLLGIAFLILNRICFYFIWRFLVKKGHFKVPVVLIDQTNSADKFKHTLFSNLNYGYQVEQVFSSIDPFLKSVSQLSVAEVFLVGVPENSSELKKIVEVCHQYHLEFNFLAVDNVFTQGSLTLIEGFPVVKFPTSNLKGWFRVSKRIFDILGSLIALCLALPLFVILAVLIKLDSAGPVLVKIKRVGKNKETFKLYKFRSMVSGAHKLRSELNLINERQEGPLFKAKNDPRITKVGKFIRRWSLDEIPQFWNVLRGEMSIIGPRPHEPEEVSLYNPAEWKLLNIKPGITGLAQISGRSDLKFKDEVELDLYYIKNWSWKLDLYILVKTPLVVLSQRGSY